MADAKGVRLEGDGITEAKNLLSQGKILAVKGLGGFHLVCDAQNEAAVKTLRRRKKRELMEGPYLALVMTSGNISQEPIVISNEEDLDR